MSPPIPRADDGHAPGSDGWDEEEEAIERDQRVADVHAHLRAQNPEALLGRETRAEFLASQRVHPRAALEDDGVPLYIREAEAAGEDAAIDLMSRMVP